MRYTIVFTFIIGLLFSCDSKNITSISGKFQFELEIVDSIQVYIEERVSSMDLVKDKGIIYGSQTRMLAVFDSTGNILAKRNFPQEGPGSIGYVIDIRLLENGDIFTYSFGNQLTLLTDELEVKRKFEMPFPAELRGASYYRHLMDFRGDKGYMFFPGRDGGNPYLKDFFANYHLLEKMDLSSGDSEPFLKLPALSKYQDGLTYEYPTVSVSMGGDLLYLTLDTESYVHVYDLVENGELKETLDFEPEKFLQKEGGNEESVSSYGEFIRGKINNLFALSDGVAIHYHQGVDRDLFLQEKLMEMKNSYKQPDHNIQKIKIYQFENGWSNEITVPGKVLAISGLNDLGQSFWGLRYDDYVNLEEDFITFYKMRLKPI